MGLLVQTSEQKRRRRLPPLENGERVTRSEFEGRYEAMHDIKKAELLGGVVYMPSPVHFEGHGEPHSLLGTWLGTYRAYTPGVRIGDNASVRLDLDNEPQPDLLLRLDSVAWRRSHIDEDDYVQGAPELVVEIAGSSKSYDLHTKLPVYRRNGVQEYIIWQVYDEKIVWYALENEQYTQLLPDAQGIARSRVFPGLWLNVNALLIDDLAQVLADLNQGIQSEEHIDFMKRLAP